MLMMAEAEKLENSLSFSHLVPSACSQARLRGGKRDMKTIRPKQARENRSQVILSYSVRVQVLCKLLPLKRLKIETSVWLRASGYWCCF